MSGDIRIWWNEDLLEGDFLFSDNDLEESVGLRTAAVISLFSDRRALDDDRLPDPSSMDKRGWWGDLLQPEVEEDQIGSRVWLLEREKTEPEVLTRAEQYFREALEWMIEDGVAVRTDVTVERMNPNDTTKLAVKVEIRKIDGTTEAMEFDFRWQEMYVEEVSLEYLELPDIPEGAILDETGQPILDETGQPILDL